MIYFLGSINSLKQLTELRETPTVTSLLKDVIEDRGEEPKEIHKERSGQTLNITASVPVELGCIPLPVWVCSFTWKLSKPLLLGFL